MGEERESLITLVPLAVMDTTLHSHLALGAEEARERALRVLDVVRLHGGAAALLWHNTYLADERAPGYDSLWEHLLDDLQQRGAQMGPISPDARPEGARLDGRRIVHLKRHLKKKPRPYAAMAKPPYDPWLVIRAR